MAFDIAEGILILVRLGNELRYRDSRAYIISTLWYARKRFRNCIFAKRRKKRFDETY